jgi:hypothetical protein
MLRPWNLAWVLDTFSAVTQRANKPFYYQGDFHGMTFEGPFNITEEEISLVDNHPGLDGIVLYETANFIKLNDDGNVVASSKFKDIVDKLNTDR